jgi:hypothetical protein
MFVCQPLQRRQDIYIASKMFFNDKIEINVDISIKLLKYMRNDF